MGAGKTLSMDLRQRAVDAYEDGQGTLQEVADRFCISPTSLCNLMALLRATGSLEPAEVRGRPQRRVDAAGRVFLHQLIATTPDATLAELTAAYNSASALTISRATLGRELKAMGLTRKKRR